MKGEEKTKRRAQAEKALQESETRYRSLFENSLEGIGLSKGNQVIDANRALLDIFGYEDLKEFLKMPLLAHIAPKSLNLIQGKLSDLEKGEPYPGSLECSIIRKDGKERQLEASVHHIVIENEVYTLSTFRDITEIKTAENKLHESEERYRSLIDGYTGPITVFDINGVILLANHAAADHFGLVRDELIGMSVRQLFPDAADAIIQRHRHIIESGIGASYDDVFEFPSDRPSGARWFTSHIQPIEYVGGKASAVLVVSHEITQRKQAEEALRESEEKWRSLAENAPNLILTVDRDGTILFLNRTETAYITPAELIGRSAYDFGVPEYREKTRQAIEEIFQTGEAIKELETKGLNVDGTIKWYSWCGGPVKFGEEVVAATLIVTDITERKLAEEKIATQLKEKTVLLQEIHHRVNNNLQVICSLLSLQSQKIEDAYSREMFGESEARVRAMSMVHEQLYQSKDLARIGYEAYLKRMASRLFASYGVSQNVIKLNVKAKDVILDINTAIPCGLIVNELVTNALKYAFPLSRKGEIHIVLELSDTTLTLTVSDNGIGFPQDLDFRDTRTLGLRLVNILTDQLGGTIELDRSGGTEFKIEFAYK